MPETAIRSLSQMLLEPIDEEDFYDFSSGFRHGEIQALLRKRVVDGGCRGTAIPVASTANAEAATSTCEPVIRGAECVSCARSDL